MALLLAFSILYFGFHLSLLASLVWAAVIALFVGEP